MVLLFVFGLFVGSFLNVLVDRFQSNENPFKGRSHCDYCKKTLAWYDLIPLLSFVSTNGKCRYCKHKLSFYYPATEFITAFLFGATYLLVGSNLINLFYGLFVISAMIVVFFSDLKYGIIPDKVVFPAILITVIGILLFPRPLAMDPIYNLIKSFTNIHSVLPYYLFSGLFSFLLFLFLFFGTRGRAMGFGDVKFSFLLGLALGPTGVVISLYVAFLTGAAVGLILILWKKKQLKTAIPFGPFLVLGFLISYFFAPKILPLVSRLLSLS